MGRGTRHGYGSTTVAESIFDLPPAERLTRFRELARESREAANHRDMLEYRDTFLKIAEQWERMANELEALIGDEK